MKRFLKKALGYSITLSIIILSTTGCNKNKEANKELSLISLDINPSIELFVDNQNIIQSVNGVNEEAKSILNDLDLLNDTLDEGLSEIVEEAVEQGYIKNSKENNILISIDGTTVDRTLMLREKAKSIINDTLKTNSLGANLVTQEVEMTDGIINEAAEKNVSIGKLYAIEQINSKLGENIQNYENISVNEIVNIGKKGNIFYDDDFYDDRDDIYDKDDINDRDDIYDKDDVNDRDDIYDKDDVNDRDDIYDKDDINDRDDIYEKDDINDRDDIYDKDDVNDRDDIYDKDDVNDRDDIYDKDDVNDRDDVDDID